MKKYDEVSVVRQLNNVDAVIEINPVSKVINVAKNSVIGNGTSGKIDFLTHYCGYHVEIVDVIQQQKERDKEITAKKAAKKAARKARFEEDNTFKGIARTVDKRMRTIKRK
ncbi:MAG: hypothetical protein [Bacteriophage sp.]|nr:MAG: hypothetical protein [Bacteriophage sp.]